jgi:hypothetical protein
MENTSEYAPIEEEHTVEMLTQQETRGEEHSEEWLKIFS